MKIAEIKITQEELNEAVSHWLTTKHNITVPVENVRRDYSWSDYTIEIKRVGAEPPAPVDAEPIQPAN